MSFKVGDKVRVVEEGTEYTGKVGIIYEVRGSGRVYKYVVYFNNNRWDWQPFNHCHIEKVAAKGQQLLFDFML